ncbi:MAG: hypothetical protein JNN04_17540 [Cyclobacteriaceae bacterium]|nr:hypothetical protein [Cyclobacteriaceae bacterium]
MKWHIPCLCGLISLGLLVLAFPAFSQVQPSACSAIKEGTFEIHDHKEGKWVITRKAGVQREENEQLGLIVEYLTEWIDECSYRLLPYKVIRNDSKIEMDASLKLIVEILEVKPNTYIHETTSWRTGKFKTEEVRIIK